MAWFEFNKMFDADAVLVDKFEEIDCDIVRRETYKIDINVPGWYVLEVEASESKAIGEGWRHGLSVILAYDHPEDGYDILAAGYGCYEEDTLAKFIEDGNARLSNNDWNVFMKVVAKYIDKKN